MKKFFYLLFGTLAFVSCVNHDIDPVTYAEMQTHQYDVEFVKAYGMPSTTHTWGFGTTTMRSASPNSNQWEDWGYVIPAEITDAEIEKVLAVFNQKGEEHYESLVDWDEFFVQQVWKGTAEYTAGNGGKVVGGNQMNWLCAGSEAIGDDHVNNFNNAAGSIMLMVNSSTQRFGYSSSTDNGHVFYYFRMEYIDGAYYVGFDFSAEGGNPNEQVQRDFIYDDWIVKIVPGKGQTPEPPSTSKTVIDEGRVFCEDLGSIGDFDFNDVVFDAIVYNDGTADITLLAAGGELDVTVAGVNVHEHIPAMTTEGATPYTFTTENTNFSEVKDIPIVVTYRGAAILLTADKGKSPQKICVPIGTKWATERTRIEAAYTNFESWVKNPNTDCWTEYTIGKVVE